MYNITFAYEDIWRIYHFVMKLIVNVIFMKLHTDLIEI